MAEVRCLVRARRPSSCFLIPQNRNDIWRTLRAVPPSAHLGEHDCLSSLGARELECGRDVAEQRSIGQKELMPAAALFTPVVLDRAPASAKCRVTPASQQS